MVVLLALYQKSVMSFFKPLSHSFHSVLPDNSETCPTCSGLLESWLFFGPLRYWTLSTTPKDKPNGVEIPSINMTSRPLPPFPALEIHKGKLSMVGEEKVKKQKKNWGVGSITGRPVPVSEKLNSENEAKIKLGGASMLD